MRPGDRPQLPSSRILYNTVLETLVALGSANCCVEYAEVPLVFEDDHKRDYKNVIMHT